MKNALQLYVLACALCVLPVMHSKATVALVGDVVIKSIDVGLWDQLVVGNSTGGAILGVNDGSVLTNLEAFTGHTSPFNMVVGMDSSGNSVLVSGTNSYLYCESLNFGYGSFNAIEVTGGAGFVSGGIGNFGHTSESCHNNSILVADPGSYFSSSAGSGGFSTFGSYNSVTVSNGAQFTGNLDLYSYSTRTSNDVVLVTGTNSIFYGQISLSGTTNCSVNINNGARMYTGGALASGGNGGSNTISIDGPRTSVQARYVTLGQIDDQLAISGGASVDTDYFYVFNGTVTFSSGVVTCKFLSCTAPGIFSHIGDGTNLANYVMQGGTHSFNAGVVISSNSVLSGCGTLIGSVTNYGQIILTNGCDMDFSGPVVNYGSIVALNGTPNFHSTFINNGTLLVNPVRVTGLSFSGNDVSVQFNTLSNYLHDVQARDDLVSGGWLSLTNALLGTGDTMSITDFGGATSSQHYYRVLLHY